MDLLKRKEDYGIRRHAHPAYTKIIRTFRSAKPARRDRIAPLDYRDNRFRRVHYVRYADDFIIGVDGSKMDVERILGRVKAYLTQTLKFELKQTAGVIHFRTTKIRFLGVYLQGNRVGLASTISYRGRKARSSLRPLIIMPVEEIREKLLELGFVAKKGKVWRPIRVGRWIHHDLHAMIGYYNSIYRGLCGYYYVCTNRALLANVHYFLKYSCALTIANKMRLGTKSKTFTKYGDSLTVPLGGRTMSFVEPDYWKTLGKKAVSGVKPPLEFHNLRGYAAYTPKVGLFDVCISGGSTEKLELPHRNKRVPRKETDYLKRIERTKLRKQVVLCSECHHKLPRGDRATLAG